MEPCNKEADIAELKTNDKFLMKEILDLKTDIKDIKSELSTFIKSADKRYASKNLEKIAIWLWAWIWWTLIPLTVYFVIKWIWEMI